jgi:LacI family transcriptional regulator
MARRPTMTDIALRAGVSQATVSLVLSGTAKARVSGDTRARVWAAAEALGYPRRGGMARANGLRVVGLLIDEVVTSPFAAPLIDGARDEAAARGAVVAVFATGRDEAVEASALDALAGPALAGVIQATLLTRATQVPARLRDLPAVLLNCHEEGRAPEGGAALPCVVPDDVGAAREATACLIRAGHRRIAHLRGEAWGEAARDRARGYRQALAEAGIAHDPALLAGPTWTVGSGREAALRLLDRPGRPTAMFCFNDRVAIGAYEAAALRGLKVPRDLSVMGFDNEDLVAHLLPPLSTMQLPHDEMARRAVAMLLDGAAAPGRPAGGRTVVECPPVPRGSVAPPREA